MILLIPNACKNEEQMFTNLLTLMKLKTDKSFGALYFHAT
jgi:hypothetical protein